MEWLGKIGERARLAEPREIVAMRVEPDARRRRCAGRPARSGSGRTIRTAISASRRARSSLRLVSASSIAMPGCKARNAARIGGSTSQPMTSLAVTRTTPRSADASPEAARASAAGGGGHRFDMRRQRQRRRRSASSPRGERVNSVRPSAASSASMCRPTVGCVRPSRRAAPDRLPSRATSMKGAQFVPVRRRVCPYENV